MNAPHTGTPTNIVIPADDRIPSPFADTATPLRCQDVPQLFAIEDITDPTERNQAKAAAQRVCSRCPIANDCLKWALANEPLTRAGVWAATTARQRTTLRNRLIQRLGPDWVAAVAEQDRRRREHQRTARRAVPQAAPRDPALARLELEAIPTRPEPYSPWTQPITPAQAAANRRVLELVASGKAA
ncbi:WhiB family transcriptional regulator [Streptomyces xanthochromogenes]|uniref:WhiB family transcriptional regulator n=1 Tax=Streptomyces xanthochromogenes TaxID=67384 RepID=UPI0034241D49